MPAFLGTIFRVKELFLIFESVDRFPKKNKTGSLLMLVVAFIYFFLSDASFKTVKIAPG